MSAGMERMTEAMLMQKAFLSGSSSSSCTALIDTRGSFILGQNAPTTTSNTGESEIVAS